jgi:heavy metal translocating P-type ATPase
LALTLVFLATTTGLLVAGGLAWLAGSDSAARWCWGAALVLAIFPSIVWVLGALRQRRVGADLIALLALVGTLAVGEYLAGALIAVMLATGRALDAAAERRARRDLSALLERAPRRTHRRSGGGVAEIDVAEVVAGDVLVVGPGEVVPVDGRLREPAVLDESALTGEARLIEHGPDELISSGVTNAGLGFELTAARTAAQSTYAGIVDMVTQASAEGSPLVRLADRFAAVFLPLALLVAGTTWLLSGSAAQAVAVLVVATPCPLLLAVPVAIVAGLSRASRLGVVVRGGAALEKLAGAQAMLIDKTGTLTRGHPMVTVVQCAPEQTEDAVLRLAASADQLSPHVLARAIVEEAHHRGLALERPTQVAETPGRGVQARVGEYSVAVGHHPRTTTADADPQWARDVTARADLDGCSIVWVTLDGALAGALQLRDPIRSDASWTVRRLRAAGVQSIVLLTGDRAGPAEEIGVLLGLDEVRSEQTPASKLDAVRESVAHHSTMMVGDGINDAPALAAATVGVAMGARGAPGSSAAADVVLTTDRIDRLADVMYIARRSRRIALQSAGIGMSLSLAAMIVAAFGLLPAAWGALLQEAIDVAAILNALRAARPDHGEAKLSSATTSLLLHFAGEHQQLHAVLPSLRQAAALVADPKARHSPRALAALRDAHATLTDRIVPHEIAEETTLYPSLARPLGGEGAVAPMSRTHAEIIRLTMRLGRHVELVQSSGVIGADQVEDLLATLYGLSSIVELHFAQEEEGYFTLAGDGTASPLQ